MGILPCLLDFQFQNICLRLVRGGGGGASFMPLPTRTYQLFSTAQNYMVCGAQCMGTVLSQFTTGK